MPSLVEQMQLLRACEFTCLDQLFLNFGVFLSQFFNRLIKLPLCLIFFFDGNHEFLPII